MTLAYPLILFLSTHMTLAYPLILFLSPLLAQPKLLPYSQRERERERERERWL